MADWEHLTPKIDRISFHIERFGASAVFGPEMLQNLRVDAHRDHMAETLVAQITAVVAVWREERTLKVPLDWWEHLKERWAPMWIRTRWPVRYAYYDAGVVLPRVPIPNRDYRVMEFPVWRRSEEA